MTVKIKPSARPNRRYLLLSSTKKVVQDVLLEYLGVLGWAKASPIFVDVNKSKDVVLAVNREEINNVRASFELSDKKIKVLKVSGTIKGLAL